VNQPVYKKIAFLAPRADLTREAFLLHWETIHGPVVASAPDYGRWRQRYVQNHIVGSCPTEWCSWPRCHSGLGQGRFGQACATGSMTVGSSPRGAMVSSVM